VTVDAGGAISLSSAIDLIWNTDATGGGVTIDNNGTIEQTGATPRPAIGTGGAAPTGAITIVNTGTISSANGPALYFATAPAGATETVTNSGTISGGGGVAIQFGAGDDVLTLQSGYSITGRVDGGSGANTLNLSGAGGGSIKGSTEYNSNNAVTFAGFDNFNTLNVQSGAWSLYGGGYYDTLNISSGATFIVDQQNAAAHGNPSDGGLGALNSSLTINNDGVLRLLNANTVGIWYDAATPQPFAFAGSGSLEVSGFQALTPGASYTVAGGVTILDGTTVVLSSLTAATTINAGATLEIGYAGGSLLNGFDGTTYVDTGTNGSITGAIVDNGTLKAARLDSYALSGALTGTGVLQKLAAGALTLQSSTSFGGRVLADGGTINLAGVVATTQASTAAVSSSGLANGAVTIVSAGTISSQTGAAVDMSAATGGVALTNNGTLSGDTSLSASAQVGVVLSSHNDTLINTGVINGAVDLGGGNDTLDSHLGTINGTVTLGSGASAATLGAENNTVSLGAGVHVVDGGGGANTVSYAGASAGVHVSLALQGQAQSTGLGSDLLSNFQTLVGSAYHDILTGSVGTSSLTGGLGADTFRVSSSAAVTTVTDFSHAQNDKIDLTTLNQFHTLADVSAAATQVGSDTVIDIGSGTLTLKNVLLSTLTASDFVLAPVKNDFDGNGVSDVSFRNNGNGDWGYLTIGANDAQGWHPLGISAAAYAVAGTGDINGDGVSDVVFRNGASGDWGYLDLSGQVQSWHELGLSNTAYALAGVGDFNGDARSDVLFRNNASGDWGYLAIGAGDSQGWHPLGLSAAAYSLVGVGDVNGDGFSDVVYRNNTNGDWGYLDLSGPTQSWHHLGVSNTAYSLAGVADFDGDGRSDILFRQPVTGDWGYLTIGAGDAQGWHPLGLSAANYSVVGTGDYNGDGRADVLFRNNASGDWGYLAIGTGDTQGWHPLGVSTVGYFVV
jgi:hypothetical protein